MSTTDTRAAFEAQQENDYSPVYLGKNNCGDYADGEVQGRWLAWKAALEWQAATEASKAADRKPDAFMVVQGGDAPVSVHFRRVSARISAKKFAAEIVPLYRAEAAMVSLSETQIYQRGRLAAIDEYREAARQAIDEYREAARQPAPVVAVKSWQERQDEDHEQWAATVYMKAEIADLRAALAATNRSQP